MKYLQTIRHLFEFRRPSLVHLDFIDLVLEKKLVLLLAWKTNHATKIKIQPGKSNYRSTVSAAVCHLPSGTKEVTIIVRNAWRAQKYHFGLHPLYVDDRTLSMITTDLLSPLSFSLVELSPELPAHLIKLKNIKPGLKVNFHIKPLPIFIRHAQLFDYVP